MRLPEIPGSPPQVRGKLPAADGENSITGITPAGAGKTTPCSVFCFAGWDHPRRCGENYKQSLTRCRRLGSPPQVRGKLNSPEVRIADHRITPAGAGKTRHPCCAKRNVWDHPRRCGENQSPITARLYTTGSPPQVRGKPYPTMRTQKNRRITPAGAGKTKGGRKMAA